MGSGWLRADLDLWQKRAASSDAAERALTTPTLGFWLDDIDLSGARNPDPLSKLPAVERKA